MVARRTIGILALSGLGIAALLYSRQSEAATGSQSSLSDLFSGLTSGLDLSITDISALGDTNVYWKTNEYPKYEGAIRDAENRWGLPTDLLGRTLYQESRYRADVIAGINRSPVGAVGIAQFMPDTAADYGLSDRTDPYASIEAAAHYLHDLYNMFGDWRSALMAYNWGPGNVLKYNQGQTSSIPSETSQYVAQITADVPVA